MSKSALRAWIYMALLLVSTVITSSILQNALIPAVFPPTAIAICAALSSPRSWLPTLAVGSTAMIALGNVLAGFTLSYALSYAVIDVAQMVVVYLLLTPEGRPGQLRVWRDLTRLLLACLAGAIIAAILGGIVDYALLPSPDINSFTFGFGISIATNLLFLPLALDRENGPHRLLGLEVLALIAVSAAATFALFGTNASVSLVPIVVPILMVAAIRFGPTVSHAMLTVLGLFAATATLYDVGPFVSPPDSRGGTILAGLQIFLLCTSIAVIVLSMTMAGERRANARALAQEVGVSRVIESAEGTAFIAADTDGVLTLFSPGAERLLGYESHEMLGRPRDLALVDTSELLARARELDVPVGCAVFTKEVDDGAAFETRDWTFICKDGTRKPVSVSVTRIRDELGDEMGYLGVVRDMTEWRAAESALKLALEREREANVLMREASSAKTDFVNNVSHELRTPLASIMGYLELLSDEMVGPVTKPQRELLERIDRNSNRLMTMIQDLLTLGEMDDGHFDLSVAQVDLCHVIQRSVNLSIVQRGENFANVAVDLPPNPILVEGDADHLTRMMLNLISNALKFTTSTGSAGVVLTATPTSAQIKVEDTGLGIPPAEQSRIFQRFFRASTAREAEIRGSGLGLSVVDEIVRAHGGDIAVRSMPGGGTTFTVTLPRTRPETL